MVARDGIEPPTPAFSGPRSTTELSGLGITLVAGDRQEPPRATSTSVARPFQESLSPAGNQQRKRMLSIAIPRRTANSGRRAILFHYSHRKDTLCPFASDAPHL